MAPGHSQDTGRRSMVLYKELGLFLHGFISFPFSFPFDSLVVRVCDRLSFFKKIAE